MASSLRKLEATNLLVFRIRKIGQAIKRWCEVSRRTALKKRNRSISIAPEIAEATQVEHPVNIPLTSCSVIPLFGYLRIRAHPAALLVRPSHENLSIRPAPRSDRLHQLNRLRPLALME
jgi:hypothetical protein